MTRVYLIRHCQAEGNINGFFQGSYDGKVTAEGERQLLKLTRRFESVPIDAAYACDLQRAYRTAQAAVGKRDIPVIPEPGFREIDGGDFEMKAWAQLPLLFPEVFDTWEKKPHLCVLPHGESTLHCRDRMYRTLLRVLETHPGQSIVVGSHACAIRVLTCVLLGWEFERLNEVPWNGNTAVTTVEFDESHRVVSLKIGDDSHLKEE